jgi:hypothetical protein
MDRIGLAQESDQWRALVNVVTNLQVLLQAGRFSSSNIHNYSRIRLKHVVR